jgi:hypothetical protein
LRHFILKNRTFAKTGSGQTFRESTQEKRAAVFGRSAQSAARRRQEGDDPIHDVPGAKKRPFLAPFIADELLSSETRPTMQSLCLSGPYDPSRDQPLPPNEHFTKTGSEHTLGKAETKRRRFLLQVVLFIFFNVLLAMMQVSDPIKLSTESPDKTIN